MGAPAHSLVLLLTSRASAMPSSMKATTFWKSSSQKWREVSAGAPGEWSHQGQELLRGTNSRSSRSPGPHGVLRPSLSQKLALNSHMESSERDETEWRWPGVEASGPPTPGNGLDGGRKTPPCPRAGPIPHPGAAPLA